MCCLCESFCANLESGNRNWGFAMQPSPKEVSVPVHAELPVPIDPMSLRRAGITGLAGAALSGCLFGLAGAITDLDGMLAIFWGGSLAVAGIGVVLYFLYMLFFAILFAATFFLVSCVVLLPGLLMLSVAGRLRPVTAAVERWLLAGTCGLCCGLGGLMAVGLWLPLETSAVLGSLLAAAGAAVMTFVKVVPRGLGASPTSTAVMSRSSGRSVWEDLE